MIGSMLGAQLRSSHMPTATLRKAVKLNPVLSSLKSKYAWFVPIFEAIIDRRHAATHASSFRRLTTRAVEPEVAGTSPVSPDDELGEFTSVVRPLSPDFQV